MPRFQLNPLQLEANNIFCIGRNYAKHAAELNNPIPQKPIVFLKPNSSLVDPSLGIHLPKESNDVHHEVEIVLAIGKDGKNIDASKAFDYIAGIAVGIDFTARDIQQLAKEKGHPWSVAKGFDTFAPISQFVRFDEAIKQKLEDTPLKLQVNGELRQEGFAKHMLFSIPTIIAYLSSIYTLQEGDLIFTGTPEGVAKVESNDKIFASFGDLVSFETFVH